MRAVVGGGELAGHGLLHVEALAEDERLGGHYYRALSSRRAVGVDVVAARGVRSSRALQRLTRERANASESSVLVVALDAAAIAVASDGLRPGAAATAA